MTMNLLVCPHCAKRLESPSNAVLQWSQLVRCPACKETYYVQAGRDRAEAIAAEESRAMIPQPRVIARPQSAHQPQQLITHQQPATTHVVVHQQEPESNQIGTAGFVLSIVALFTAGCLSPLALLLCGAALFARPRGFAFVGVLVSLVGMIPMALIAIPIMLAVLGAPIAASQSRQQRQATSSQHQSPRAVPVGRITLSNVRQTTTGTGGVIIRMDVTNATSRPLKRLRADVTFADASGRVFCTDTVSIMADSSIAAFGTGQIAFAPRPTSSLRDEVPENAVGSAVVVEATDLADEQIPLAN